MTRLLLAIVLTAPLRSGHLLFKARERYGGFFESLFLRTVELICKLAQRASYKVSLGVWQWSRLNAAYRRRYVTYESSKSIKARNTGVGANVERIVFLKTPLHKTHSAKVAF
jgi:hypothetical protein